MKLLLAIIGSILIAILGWNLQRPPYRLDKIGLPSDQSALAHRDSAYSSSTWIASPGDNFMQLRFFDRVEGGIALHPSWAELRRLAATDPRLAHLATDTLPTTKAPEASWTYDWTPDPGTLPHTKYVVMFPAGVLLNEGLMTAAGGDLHAAKPNILVVGLGSGVGIAVLAHHLPHASITVVDIDRTVIELVQDHYPLLRWLESQKTADGRPRLRMVAQDARKFIRLHDGKAEEHYDLVILDAYTSGSTIPPHLMTREFYGECKAAMNEGGILLSNIIGSYRAPTAGGTKHLVLGGALRAMREAGFVNAHNLPILRERDALEETDIRNNVLLASAAPLGPKKAAVAWNRLKNFVPYPELAKDRPDSTTRSLALSDGKLFTSVLVPLGMLPDALALRPNLRDITGKVYGHRWISEDPKILAEAMRQVKAAFELAKRPVPDGWSEIGTSKYVFLMELDLVDHAREVWSATVHLASDASRHSGDALIGTPEDQMGAFIPNAPLFTDARPNADIYNGG